MPTKHSKLCQMTMGDGGRINGVAHYWLCEKPAKAWISDPFKRAGWKGKQYLCGIHARAHDKVAERYRKKKANKL